MEEKNNSFFSEFYEQYLRVFDERCIKLGDRLSVQILFPSVREFVHKELVELTYLTLVYELNVYRELGKLIGDTSENRYNYFESLVTKKEFHEYLKEEYPVLTQLINQKIEHVLKCVENIIGDFIKDEEEIKRIFKISNTKINDIKIGAGDSHEYGKTIAIIYGDFGKLVYKAHSLENDIILNKAYSFLDDEVKFKPMPVCVVSKESHGWQQFIENKECATEEEVERFYYRLGCFCAIFFIFNSGDMHFENIIASGEVPYIIDTETLITLSKVKDLKVCGDVHNYPVDNILSTCLFPINNKNGVIDIDMSGLSGGDFKSDKMKGYKILNAGTDKMKVTREIIDGVASQDNIPCLKGKQVDVIKYKKHLLDGMEHAMCSFINKKKELYRWIQSSDFDKSIQRQLFRDTYIYARFLEASYHPIYLRSFQRRKELFDNLTGSHKERISRISHEIEILNNGYIPAYYTLFNSNDLYSSGKIIQKAFYEHTAKETVKYKISMLTSKTISMQKHIINLSYMTLVKDLFIKNNYSNDKEKTYLNYLHGFRSVFELISSNNLVNPEDESNDLYMIRLNESSQSLQGLDLSLYEGGGLIWSVFSYARQEKDEILTSKSLSWLETAEKKNRLYSTNPGISLFSGQGSLVYLFYNFYKTTKTEDYWNRCCYYLKEIEKEITNVTSLDYMHGICGITYLLLKLHRAEKDKLTKSILEKAIKVIGQRLEEIIEIDIVGFAHGMSGVSMVLVEAYNYTRQEKFLIAANKLLKKEEIISSENMSWCRGIGGILLARGNILNTIDSDNPIYALVEKQFHVYLHQLLNCSVEKTKNLCLCHGLYGDYEILNCIYNQNNNILTIDERDMLHHKLDSIAIDLIQVTPDRLWLNFDYNLDTFMLGTSGIGYCLLRLYNNVYPSILNLELVK